jgi:molybdate transport system substrate-binding protein
MAVAPPPRRVAILTRIAGVAVAAVAGIIAASCRPQKNNGGQSEIEVLCAAGLRVPVEEAARLFEGEGLGRVRLQFGGSQSLLSALEVSKRGDIFLPADRSYVETARAKGLVGETFDLTIMTAVVAVKSGNPKGVRSLADLQRSDVRLVLANPDLAAVSQLASKALPAGAWQGLVARAVVMKPTVTDAANDIALGAADAGIVWDATVHQSKDLERVDLPELQAVKGHVSGAVVLSGSNQAAALRLLRWLAAPEKGAPVFRKHGYAGLSGDPWSDEPSLTLMAGAMLRPAIEPTIAEFEEREGCRVDRIYNGCGILIGQMKAGGPADVFFSCDASFMSQVAADFPDAREVSSNRLVILVKKGNPHGIRSLQDLGRPGLKVGVGNEKQCALGVLTQTTLAESGWRSAVLPNIVVQAPAGDLLVNQLLAGGLDAAVTYVSNAAGSADRLEAIAISLPCAVAQQPVGVSRNAKHPRLAARLVAALTSEKSRQRFEAMGFGWEQ